MKKFLPLIEVILIFILFGFSCSFLVFGYGVEAIWGLLAICVMMLMRIIDVLEEKR